MEEDYSNPSSSIEDEPTRQLVKSVESHVGHDLYNSGRPLWTREQLLDIKAQLAANPQKVTIHTRLGGSITWDNPAFDKPENECRAILGFEGRRHITHPDPQSNGNPLFYSVILYTYKEDENLMESYSTLRPYPKEKLREGFNTNKEIWERSRARYCIEELLSKYELPPTIDKVLCFGLGNGVYSTDYHDSSQHPAALTIREFLQNRMGHPVRLLTQDPEYNSTTRSILKDVGFDIVGMNGLDTLTCLACYCQAYSACNIIIYFLYVDMR
ncbi:hypothetical protein F5Y09DRAFT_64975 [Xylaria sp. FL1042]|nr:hypothetical protein F5Y09DRAFT_64975 [Xylaria sp. FL1042]